MMPPFHDPRTRNLIDETPSGWEVWGHALNSPRHAYFAPRGMLHLQWWLPTRQVSVITPSRLTDDKFEVWTPEVHVRFCCHVHMTARMLERLELAPPCRCAMQQYSASFVRVFEIGTRPKPENEFVAPMPW
ncbi:MAG: hypothetical protein AAGA48_25540 [Myxococcota bacterium]